MITLVAVFMLFVVGAMAALSIDAVTLYTARSEAQLAADAAALAGARVLANSGVTSNPSTALITAAWNLASAVATQVAQQNQVGGGNLTSITIPSAAGGTNTNPTITVTVQKNDLPTFFARIWGRTAFTVSATATAEAYNPSGATGAKIPVAPICVKPWLLPNIDPTQASAGGPSIFDPTTGAITDPTLVNKGWPGSGSNTNGLRSRSVTNAPRPGRYYAGAIDAADFPEPTQSLPACSAGFSTYPYMVAIAGCVPRPIACGATVDLAPAAYASKTGSRDGDAVEAVGCLIHYNGAAGDTDSIDTTVSPYPPFEFLAGNENPVTSAKDVLVSDSLVTIPVYDSTTAAPGASNPVTVIGFLQVFLNPLSAALPLPSPPAPGPNQIPVTIINMAGCGTAATGQPILGNGASPVVVRLISAP